MPRVSKKEIPEKPPFLRIPGQSFAAIRLYFIVSDLYVITAIGVVLIEKRLAQTLRREIWTRSCHHHK